MRKILVLMSVFFTLTALSPVMAQQYRQHDRGEYKYERNDDRGGRMEAQRGDHGRPKHWKEGKRRGNQGLHRGHHKGHHKACKHDRRRADRGRRD